MFFRKLCRNNGVQKIPPAERNAGIRCDNVNNQRSPNPLEITRRPTVGNDANAAAASFQFESNNRGGNCSSGPPLRDYNPLPTTPPPSYTPREPKQLYRRLEVCSNGSSRPVPVRAVDGVGIVDQGIAAAGYNRCERNVFESSDSSGSRSSRTSRSYNNSPSSDDDDDDDDITSNIRLSSGNDTLQVNGAYCPDLLNACSLILPLQETDSSPERQSPGQTNRYNSIRTASRPNRSLSAEAYSSSDYAEIEDFSISSASNNNALTSAKSTSELYHQRPSFSEGCVTDSSTAQQLNQMGQNLSLRRPRISLTWVLREQQNQHQQQQQQDQPTEHDAELQNNNNATKIDAKPKISAGLEFKKKLKSKTKEQEKLFSEKYVSNHNLQEFQEKREPSKDLMFVCTPSRQPVSIKSSDNTTAPDSIVRRRLEAKNVLEKKCFKASENNVLEKCEKEDVKSLKGTYSEPSLIAASEGHHRRHRHRKRRDRNRVQKFGYEIRNVDEFLSKCSLASPGNIPVVLSSSSTLYQTRPGGYQIEIPLPLGMVVNAVFKNQNWLYVQTPHAEEGYVGYTACLPLGILPPAVRGNSTSKPTPCWETNGDVFPRPCGNMTDSEKEIRLRGGTRSDGARTPRLRRLPPSGTLEHHVDKLYLRAASQPKLTEKAYAQLKSTNMYKKQSSMGKTAAKAPSVTPAPSPAVANQSNASARPQNEEYDALQQQKSKLLQKQQCLMSQKAALAAAAAASASTQARSLRQTLVAIMSDYATESITLQKGEIVTLCECRESRDRRQWFYVRTRDGREGYIPAEVAGHGFL